MSSVIWDVKTFSLFPNRVLTNIDLLLIRQQWGHLYIGSTHMNNNVNCCFDFLLNFYTFLSHFFLLFYIFEKDTQGQSIDHHDSILATRKLIKKYNFLIDSFQCFHHNTMKSHMSIEFYTIKCWEKSGKVFRSFILEPLTM